MLGRLFLGSGRLRDGLRAQLEAEGLVALEEGLWGTVRYHRFRAPGRRHDGKITGERMALGISEARFVVYSRSGRAELIDSAFGAPNLRALEVSLEGDDKVVLRVDYGKLDLAEVSGVITIRARTPKAAALVEELNARLGDEHGYRSAAPTRR